MPVWRIFETILNDGHRYLLILPFGDAVLHPGIYAMSAHLYDEGKGDDTWNTLEYDDQEYYLLEIVRHTMREIDVTTVWGW